MSILLELLVIFVLILANGFLSMAEFALVSSNRVRLEMMAEEGSSGASAALAISEDPNSFLSAIQIGITLIGVLSGAFGGASFAKYLSPFLSHLPYIGEYSNEVALIVIVLLITYLTIVVGELVPKRIGLYNPEKVAVIVAKPISMLITLTQPVIWLTSVSTNGILLLGKIESSSTTPVTEEEISILLEEGTRAGTIDISEQEIVQSVFKFADREVTSMMVPRPDMIAINLDDEPDEIIGTMMRSGHTRYPVYRHDLDNMVGVVSVRDIWARMASGKPADIETVMHQVLMVPASLKALALLELFKNASSPLAVLVDEYGSVRGMVTVHDLIETIVGDINSGDKAAEDPDVVRREDGSWFIDGTYPIVDLKDLLDIMNLEGEDEHHFRTIAGFLITRLDRIARTGDIIVSEGYRFEVADMDGHRIDKIIVSRINVPDTK